MDDGVTVEPTAEAPAQETAEQPPVGESSGINPAWNPLLSELPTSLHSMVTPHLKNWDTNFKTEIEKVQSQYNPYKSLVDNKIDPAAIEQAMTLFDVMNRDPRLVYDNLGEHFGYSKDQGQPPVGQEPTAAVEEDYDITQHPKFQELLQNQNALAEVLLKEQQSKEFEKVSQGVEAELAAIKQGSPDIDEAMVLRLALSTNQTITEAAKQLNDYNNRIVNNTLKPAPRVMSSGGQVQAAQQPDPTKMDSKSTRSLVADMLRVQHGG